MDSFLCLQVVLLLIACGNAGFIRMEDPDSMWVEIGEEATMHCKWEYQDNTNISGSEVLTWEGDGAGLRKITRNDPDNTFVFRSSKITEDRQEAETLWEEDVKEGRLTIFGIRITDPTEIECKVEANFEQETKKANIHKYAIPSVSMSDVVVSVDVRIPIVEESSNETDVNTTASIAEESIPEYGDDADDYPSDEASEEGQKIVVECIIREAYPKPSKIEFVLSESERFEAEADNIFIDQTEDDDGNPSFFEGYARLELDPETKYNGKQFTCEVEIPTEPNPTVQKSENASSAIEIFHTTTWVSAKITPGTAVEGESVTITCDSDGNPRPSFSVTPGGNVVATSNPDVFEIDPVKREDAGTYICSADIPDRTNPGTFQTMTGSDSLEVEYLDEPTLSDSRNEITLTKGDEINIVCGGRANPPAAVDWMHNGKVYQRGGDLSLQDVQYGNAGVYTCESSSSSDLITDRTQKSVTIKVEGRCEAKLSAPVISSSSAKPYSLRVQLECKVTGQPLCQVAIHPPSSIQIEGEYNKVDDSKYTLVYEEMDMLPSPATFFCVASNSVGTPANVSLVLDESTDACCKPPKKGGLGTGAIIGIILLVLVVVIGIPVACYFVRRKKAEPKSKSAGDMESAEPEKEELNKEESSEDSDTGSLPPPPAETNDHRLNSAHEMTTFSTNQ